MAEQSDRQRRAVEQALRAEDEAAKSHDEAGKTSAKPPQAIPPGWFLYQPMPGTKRYWDGDAWTDHYAPIEQQRSNPPASKTAQHSQLAVALVLAGSVIGVVMAMQSASLLTGTGMLWTGAAIASGASIAAWAMRGSVPTWVRVVAVLAALLAIANAATVENALEEKRQEISNIFP